MSTAPASRRQGCARPHTFDFVPANDHGIASHQVTRAFARIVAATAYAFASVVTIEPRSRHYVKTGSDARHLGLSCTTTALRLLRDAFPTLPIRALYVGAIQKRMYAGWWPGPSVPEMVDVARARRRDRRRGSSSAVNAARLGHTRHVRQRKKET